jgi:hypothetical protein
MKYEEKGKPNWALCKVNHSTGGTIALAYGIQSAGQDMKVETIEHAP